jgi:RNA polymerase sigma-70 factor (ECF subfamily)
VTQRTTDELLRTTRTPDSPRAFGDAVAELIERYKLVVYQQALRNSGDRSLADDVFQETFLRLFRWLGSRPRNVAVPSFPRLLTTFARRAAIDLVRKRRPATELPETIPGPTDRLDTICYVQELMETLDERPREVLRLSYFEGWSAEEVAQRLDLTPGNVRVIRHRALEQVRDRIRADDEADSETLL